jgi:hypothetical protein
MPQSESLADRLAGRNRTFYNLKRSYRYLEFDSEQEDDVDAQIEVDDARAQEDDVQAQKRKVSCLL